MIVPEQDKSVLESNMLRFARSDAGTAKTTRSKLKPLVQEEEAQVCVAFRRRLYIAFRRYLYTADRTQ